MFLYKIWWDVLAWRLLLMIISKNLTQISPSYRKNHIERIPELERIFMDTGVETILHDALWNLMRCTSGGFTVIFSSRANLLVITKIQNNKVLVRNRLAESLSELILKRLLDENDKKVSESELSETLRTLVEYGFSYYAIGLAEFYRLQKNLPQFTGTFDPLPWSWWSKVLAVWNWRAWKRTTPHISFSNITSISR